MCVCVKIKNKQVKRLHFGFAQDIEEFLSCYGLVFRVVDDIHIQQIHCLQKLKTPKQNLGE